MDPNDVLYSINSLNMGSCPSACSCAITSPLQWALVLILCREEVAKEGAYVNWTPAQCNAFAEKIATA